MFLVRTLCVILFAGAGTLLAVDIEGSLTGYFPAGTYTVVDDIQVPAGGTLTLAPGVIFEFETGLFEDYEFEVEGKLIAIGTAAQQIIFRPASAGDEYNYIRLSEQGTHMSHCLVEGAGKVDALDEGGLWIDGSSPLIEHCEIRGGSWHGVFVTGSSALPQILSCSIHDNDGDGVDCDDGAGLDIRLCTVTGNGTDGLCISSGANTIVNCLIAGNGEDGIDCRWLASQHALILNCTIGNHPAYALNAASEFEMINCAVVAEYDEIAEGIHTYIIDDAGFLGFQNPGGLDFHLSSGSPCLESGYRFGEAAALLPATDLDGNPRINGIVDIGAYESTAPPATGEEGTYFSRALLSPRMTQAVIRERGESFTVQVAMLGGWSQGDAAVRLVSPMQEEYPLTVTSVQHRDRTPGSDLDLLLYGPGIETVQEIVVQIPSGTPEDFYDIEVDLGPCAFHSIHAVKVLEEYPEHWGFMHITDTHIDYDNGDYSTAERFRYFAREANFLDPELVVHTGDACDFEHIGTPFNDSLLAVLSELRVPLVVVAGNHDHYNWTWVSHNPCGYLYFFQVVNRVMNSEVRFGDALLYCTNSGPDEGLIELARCFGPSVALLDWIGSRLDGWGGTLAGPLFFLSHGPTFDYYMWSMNSTDLVVQMLEERGFSLALAGHTHRMESYLNEGENYYGRNDFYHADDWVRDVAFPGFPLHVQTSSLGKGDGLGWTAPPASVTIAEALATGIEHRGEKGLDSDSIAWRWIQVDDDQVSFFTSDTDGDGYRNTEWGWLLGALQFQIDSLPEGAFLSTVSNGHREDWHDVLHYIPADPSVTYEAAGGELVRQLPDGTVVVAVDILPSEGTSQVLITPVATSMPGEGGAGEPGLGPCTPLPFSSSVTIGYTLPEGAAPIEIFLVDMAGRRVRTLLDGPAPGGSGSTSWDGSGQDGSPLPSGIYFCVLRSGDFYSRERLLLLR